MVDLVPFLDLLASQRPLEQELRAVWEKATSVGQYVGGPEVEHFERLWAETCGVSHAIGVGNGTDALEMALRGLGVGPGDEVLVPANTFIATAEAVVSVGASPRFVDVDPVSLLVTAETVGRALTARTSALVVVHLYGQAADMTAITDAAHRHGLVVVEDCAQAQGARWDGRPVGSFGSAGCTSFYPGKNLGAFGDGGAVFTDDADLADRIRQVGDHGRSPVSKYEHPVIGRNSRLDALQAAVLSVKLPHLQDWNASRREASSRYAKNLDGLPGLQLTVQDPRSTSVHHLEVVRVKDREGVAATLLEDGIRTGVHYPVACHRQPGYSHFDHADAPVAEAAAPQLLSLPMFAGITEDQVDRVCESLHRALPHV